MEGEVPRPIERVVRQILATSVDFIEASLREARGFASVGEDSLKSDHEEELTVDPDELVMEL